MTSGLVKPACAVRDEDSRYEIGFDHTSPGVSDNYPLTKVNGCLVPVRRLSKPSWSMHFGDVSETNGRETASKTFLDHVTRNASAAHNNEA